MSKTYTVEEVHERTGWSYGHIRRMCRNGELPGAYKEGGGWRIPADAHPKLASKSSADIHSLKDVSADKREKAAEKLGFIEQFRKFEAEFEGKKRQAVAMFCKYHGLGTRTLYNWLSRYRSEGLAGLVDMRGSGQIDGAISAEAFEVFKSMYLTQQQLSIKHCWQNINYINSSENRGWQIPPLRTMQRYVRQFIPENVIVLHREGIEAYNAKCAPYIQQAPDSVRPGEVFIGDHHQLNCWIRHRGKWVRPWLTGWEDMRSRAIVGFWISTSPNQTTILQAFKRAVQQHGPPDSVKIDNGKDYDSEMWTGMTKTKRKALKAGYIDEKFVAGLYGLMDVKASFAIPYRPQSKRIERLFDTVDRQFTKTIDSYCGKDSARKPEKLNEMLKSASVINSAHTLESFREVFGKYAEAYNNTAHTGDGMAGKSPVEVIASRISQRVLPDGVLDLLMRVWSGELKVGKNGVRFKGLWYGQYDMDLAAYQNKKVRVAYDPDDMREVYVYDGKTMKLITIAEQNRLISYGDKVSEEALREAMRQKTRARRIARQFADSRLTANMDLTNLTIKAMDDAAKPQKQQPKQKRLRPVVTPFNDQVEEHRRKKNKQVVKKAVGMEDTSRLNIDLSQLKQKHQKRDFNLFDG